MILDTYLEELYSKSRLLAILGEVNPRKVNDKLLLEYHRKCHMLYAGNIKRKNVNKEFISFIVKFHDEIVEEMTRRGFQHKTPLEKI